MGQYYAIFNKTKKEFFSPMALGDGVKLREFSYGGRTVESLCLLLANSNGRGGGDWMVDDPYMKLVQGRWAGDEIVIQGDYATEGDPSFIVETGAYRNIGSFLEDFWEVYYGDKE